MYRQDPSMEEILRALLLANRGRQVTAYHMLLGTYPPEATRPTAPLLLNITNAAKYLGVSRSTLYRLFDEGLLPQVRLTGGRSQVRTEDLERYVANLEQADRLKNSPLCTKPKRRPNVPLHHHPDPGP